MSRKSGIRARIFLARGTITSADITGTDVGQLGHADGYILVPTYGPEDAVALISATISMAVSDGIAYTGGGDTTINQFDGVPLTAVASNTLFIQSTGTVSLQFVPIATSPPNEVSSGLSLVTTAAPTNPGNATGIIKYAVYYTVNFVEP